MLCNCDIDVIVVKYCVLFLMYLLALPTRSIPNCSGNKFILNTSHTQELHIHTHEIHTHLTYMPTHQTYVYTPHTHSYLTHMPHLTCMLTHYTYAYTLHNVNLHTTHKHTCKRTRTRKKYANTHSYTCTQTLQ